MEENMFDALDRKSNCQFVEDTVAYVYKELRGTDLDKFEVHMADCDSCCADVAAFGSVTTGINEWKALEFDTLETPNFQVPIVSQPTPEKVSIVTWFKGLMDATPMLWQGASVCAAVLVLLGLIWVFVPTGSSSDNMAKNPASPKQDSSTALAADGSDQEPAVPTVASVNDVEEQTPIVEDSTDTGVVDSTVKKPVKSTRVSSPKRTKTVPVKRLAKTQKKTPKKLETATQPSIQRLTELAVTVEDRDEDDLRLSDLFATGDEDEK